MASFSAEYKVVLKDPETVITWAKTSLGANVLLLWFSAFPRVKISWKGLKKLFLIVETRLIKITTPVSEDGADNKWNEELFRMDLHLQRYVEFS